MVSTENERSRLRRVRAYVLCLVGALLIAAVVAGTILWKRSRDARLLRLGGDLYLMQRMRESAPLPIGYDGTQLSFKSLPVLLRDSPAVRAWLFDVLQNKQEKSKVRWGAAVLLFKADDPDTQRHILTEMADWVRKTDPEGAETRFRNALGESVSFVGRTSLLSDQDCLHLLRQLGINDDVLREGLERDLKLTDDQMPPYEKATRQRLHVRQESLLNLLNAQKRAAATGGASDGTKAP